MLPFDKKPWAKHVAAVVIAVTLIGAVSIPIVLHYRKALDLPIVVGIVLLVLAIVPPNIVVLRRRPEQQGETKNGGPQRPRLYTTRTAGR